LVLAATGAIAQTSGGGVGHLYGVDYTSGELYRVNENTAEIGLVGNTGIANLGGLEFSPEGVLYADTVGTDAALYRINPNTAEATRIGALNAGFIFEGGIAFGNGNAYTVNLGTSTTASLMTLDLNTGQATAVGEMGLADINGLSWRARDSKLIGLDREGSRLVVINPLTAELSTLKLLTIPVGSVGGMTVYNGKGYFSTSGPKSTVTGSNSLYSFDLETGDYTLVGSYPATMTDGIGGLAAVPEPGTLIALGAGLSALATRRRRRTR